MNDRITKLEVAARLDAAIHYPAGMEGLNILLYGWTRKNPQLRVNIHHRDWLYLAEVQSLSEYAGVDLTKNDA